MRIVISAGGTGGHIYPAIAIINKVKQLDKDSEFLYIGTTDRMEKDLIPEMNIRYEGIPMKGLNRKRILDNLSVLIMYKKGVKKAKKILKEFQPDVVIGTGGYITAPVLIAAHSLKIKTIIHEQNSIPGVSNKHLSKYVDKVLVSMPNAVNYFDKKKCVYTGNPRSEEIAQVKPIDKKELGFDVSKKLVVIVMGSLGSATINERELELVSEFKNKNYEVLLVTGEKYYNDYKNIKIPSNVKVVPFLKNFINVLKSCDLVVSRAGASTISEITAIGLPSILVPSPYVTNNHQYKNAKELEDAKASVILLEKDFNKDNLLPLIDSILCDKEKYLQMVKNTRKFGVLDSATKVYNEIKKVVED